MSDWKVLHLSVMRDFLLFLNSRSKGYVLKGGTSLMLCYNLNRFSEDIDLDGIAGGFFKIVDAFVNSFKGKYVGITYRNGKDTDTVKRALIHYGGKKPLKIEVSYRLREQLSSNCVTVIDGICVYPIDRLMYLKLIAFLHRDKIRDLFDIVFIYNNYKQYLSTGTLIQLQDAVAFKGLEQFDFLIKDQDDELIDKNYLAEQFLYMYYDLGLR